MIQSIAPPKRASRPAASNTEPRPLNKPTQLDDDVAEDLVQCFKLFADETRLRILHYLMQQKEMHVRALCTLLEQSQPAVSHHLALLRVAGFIDSRRDGKHNYYHLAPKRFHELLHKLFSADSTEGSLQIFENYVLRWPVNADGGPARGRIATVALSIGGVYFAKWRLIGGQWRVESETYVPDYCRGGPYCLSVP